jgi:LPS-assembly protein
MLASLLASGVAVAPAEAETLFGQAWPETGGWGAAWGADTAAPPPRSATPAAPAPAVPSGQGTLFGQAWPDAGGWGSAWGDEVPSAPPPVRAPAAAMTQAAAQPVPSASDGPVASGGAPPRYDVSGQPGSLPPRLPLPPKRKSKQPGAPEDEDEDEPVKLTADQVVHDRELSVVSAVGKVEIVHQGRTLIADNVSYSLKSDVVSATGNVTLIEPTGEVTFADYVELTGDFKNGVAKEIKVLMKDRSRMAAATAQRSNGVRTDFEQAAYTACEPCRKDPSRTPLWQAKAARVTHSEIDHTIEYRDAWLEVMGVPVAYTPYLSHPDPTVKRESGFLTPTAGMNSTLGPSVTIPYFWAISGNEDLTISPRFMGSQRSLRDSTTSDADATIMQHIQIAAQHRWVGPNGEAKGTGSITEDKNTGQVRGHVDATGRFDLDHTWRTGYMLQRTSDDTYTRLYNVRIDQDRPWLTTRPYIEGFGRRTYALAEGFSFQSSRIEDDPGNSPLVLPHLIYSYTGEPGWKGSYWTVDSDMLAYYRSEGTDSTRLSSAATWNLPWTTRFGEVYHLSASVRGDGYHSTDLQNAERDASATTGRLIPQVAMTWRMPFASSQGIPQVLEPLMMVAASPNGNNPTTIPNEDSIDVELDEGSVLRPTRLVGLDRVEGGLRAGYGLRWVGYPYRGGHVLAQVAQGWRAHADDTFAANSGFADNFSDYLGRIEVSPSGNLTLSNRSRLDKDTLSLRRNESSVLVGPQALRTTVSYTYYDSVTSEAGQIFPRRNYLGYGITSRLSENWGLRAMASNDLTSSGGFLGWTGEAIYNDECLAVVSRLRRYYTDSSSGILSGYDLTFNIVLKTLGGVPITAF